jgi:GNAT superfamily N-acetyltransferase
MRWAIERVFDWDQVRQETSFAEWFKPDEVWIVVVDGSDAGWIQWRADEESVVLGSIYVAPSMQRKGIGNRGAAKSIRHLVGNENQPGSSPLYKARVSHHR